MSKKIKNAAGKTSFRLLKLWGLLLSVVIGVLGNFSGCCQKGPMVLYGPQPLYGVITPDYGVEQVEYQAVAEEETAPVYSESDIDEE